MHCPLFLIANHAPRPLLKTKKEKKENQEHERSGASVVVLQSRPKEVEQTPSGEETCPGLHNRCETSHKGWPSNYISDLSKRVCLQITQTVHDPLYSNAGHILLPSHRPIPIVAPSHVGAGPTTDMCLTFIGPICTTKRPVIGLPWSQDLSSRRRTHSERRHLHDPPSEQP